MHLPPLVLPTLVPTCSNSVYAHACFRSCLLLFAPVLTYCPFVIHVCSYLLPTCTLGCPICRLHAFIWVCFCMCPCPLSFVPAVVCACCLCLFLPTARVHSQSSMLMLNFLVRVCPRPLLLAVIICTTYRNFPNQEMWILEVIMVLNSITNS